MSVISVRVNNNELAMLENASKIYGCGISGMIKQIVFEKLEDEYDMRAIAEYETEKSNKTLKTRPIEEFWEELGL